MRYYPLLLNLRACRILIAGAGDVGRRKAADVLSANPEQLLWLDPSVPASDLPESVRNHPALHYEQRCADCADVTGHHLVFAATSSRAANAAILQACREKGIACNAVDDPKGSGFIVPSHFSCDDVMLTVSTGGGSPALTKKIRKELEEWFEGRYRALLIFMTRVRPLVLAQKCPSTKNAALFRALVDSQLGQALADADRALADDILRGILPPALHHCIEELLHDLV